MTGRFDPEQVADLVRNRWPICPGFSKQDKENNDRQFKHAWFLFNKLERACQKADAMKK
jgi:hypothetical protein